MSKNRSREDSKLAQWSGFLDGQIIPAIHRRTFVGKVPHRRFWKRSRNGCFHHRQFRFNGLTPHFFGITKKSRQICSILKPQRTIGHSDKNRRPPNLFQDHIPMTLKKSSWPSSYWKNISRSTWNNKNAGADAEVTLGVTGMFLLIPKGASMMQSLRLLLVFSFPCKLRKWHLSDFCSFLCLPGPFSRADAVWWVRSDDFFWGEGLELSKNPMLYALVMKLPFGRHNAKDLWNNSWWVAPTNILKIVG